MHRIDGWPVWAIESVGVDGPGWRVVHADGSTPAGVDPWAVWPTPEQALVEATRIHDEYRAAST